MDGRRVQRRSAANRSRKSGDDPCIPPVVSFGAAEGDRSRSDHESALWSSPAHTTISNQNICSADPTCRRTIRLRGDFSAAIESRSKTLWDLSPMSGRGAIQNGAKSVAHELSNQELATSNEGDPLRPSASHPRGRPHKSGLRRCPHRTIGAGADETRRSRNSTSYTLRGRRRDFGRSQTIPG